MDAPAAARLCDRPFRAQDRGEQDEVHTEAHPK